MVSGWTFIVFGAIWVLIGIVLGLIIGCWFDD